MNRIFHSSLGYVIDLERLLVVEEPRLIEDLSHYALITFLTFQVSSVCMSLQGCRLQHVVQLQREWGNKNEHSLKIQGNVTIPASEVKPEHYRSLLGQEENGVENFWKGYDKLVSAWQQYREGAI